MRRLPEALIDIRQTQSGLLTHAQLMRFGFRRREIDCRIACGDWQRVTERVISTSPPPVDRMTKLWAASLHFEGCGLAGASALEILGMPTPHDGRIHVIGPPTGRQPPMSNVIVHTNVGFALGPGLPARVSIDLAVVQALRWATSDRQAVFHATWAIQKRFIGLEQLEALGRDMPKSPGSAVMRHRLRLLDPGIHSMPEFDFARQCRLRGLPEPQRQRQRLDSRGRHRYTDAEFVIAGQRLVVEIDGYAHLETEVHLDDQWRANEIVLQGAPVLRLPALALRLDPDAFFTQLRRALDQLRRAA
jgi:very-short-patch-repair endonuclease